MVERTREARRLAERGLIWLLWELRDTTIRPITLGGLVPEILAEGQEPTVPVHQGTTDVDLHLAVEIDTASRDLAALQAALERAGFAPAPKSVGRWQWQVDVEGALVRVDLLCDNADVQAEHVIRVSDRLGIMNLRGTGYVTDDFAVHPLAGSLHSGEQVTVDARFAGLAGYLLTKCVSALVRRAPKDFYDLAYVLLYNKHGGPSAAVAAALAPAMHHHVAGLAASLREVRERFRAIDSPGTQAFVELHELASPGGDRSQLAQDAIAAVDTFTSELLTPGA